MNLLRIGSESYLVRFVLLRQGVPEVDLTPPNRCTVLVSQGSPFGFDEWHRRS
jgi:hypothetical protein